MTSSTRSNATGSRRVLVVMTACLVVVLAGSLVWMSQSSETADHVPDESVASSMAVETTVETTVDTTPRTLTSIPFCDSTSSQLAESGGDEGPQEPDDTFWAEQEELGDAGRAVEAVYGDSPTWAGFYLDANRSLVFRFTERDPERDAEIAAIVAGLPHLVVQTEFSDADRRAAVLRLREALAEAGQGNVGTGAEEFGVTGWGSAGLTQYIEIDLFDHDQVESWPQRLGLDPPYDIYCFNPRLVVGE